MRPCTTGEGDRIEGEKVNQGKHEKNQGLNREKKGHEKKPGERGKEKGTRGENQDTRRKKKRKGAHVGGLWFLQEQTEDARREKNQRQRETEERDGRTPS